MIFNLGVLGSTVSCRALRCSLLHSLALGDNAWDCAHTVTYSAPDSSSAPKTTSTTILESPASKTAPANLVHFSGTVSITMVSSPLHLRT